MDVRVIRPRQPDNLGPRLAVHLWLDCRRLVRGGARDRRQVAPFLHLMRVENIGRPIVAQAPGAVFPQCADVATCKDNVKRSIKQSFRPSRDKILNPETTCPLTLISQANHLRTLRRMEDGCRSFFLTKGHFVIQMYHKRNKKAIFLVLPDFVWIHLNWTTDYNLIERSRVNSKTNIWTSVVTWEVHLLKNHTHSKHIGLRYQKTLSISS